MSGGTFLIIAAAYGASGVALGAFGAHGLRSQLTAASLETWQTAVIYHLVHALALLGTGLWLRFAQLFSSGAGSGAASAPNAALVLAGWSFVAGIVLFSGSLYLLALGGPRMLGPLTPVGGVALILGWLALSWAGAQAAR